MSATGAIVTDASGIRTYSCQSCGGEHLSVTSLLSLGVPKQGPLVPWASRLVATAAVTEQDWRHLPAQEAIDYLRSLPTRRRDSAADVGKAIHRAIECDTLGIGHPTPPLPIRPHMSAYAAWVERAQPQWEAAEMVVHNCAYGYSGTCDGIAVVDGRRYLIDIKTGPKHPYPEAALQLAAYRHATVADAGAALVPMPATQAAGVLRVTAERAELIAVETSEEVFEAFLSVAAVAQWSRGLAKRVIGLPVRSEIERAERSSAAITKYSRGAA